MEVSAAMPDDVRLLHDVLECAMAIFPSPTEGEGCPKGGIGSFDLQNCGTAMRFLTAYFAQLPGCDVTLTGCERMRERPIGQLVDALRTRGARIEYKEREGYPPLHIIGQDLGNHSISGDSGKSGHAGNPIILNNPQSTQYISALLLTGFEVETNCTSPYIAMTRAIIQSYNSTSVEIERDWSAAAFWLERWALGLCPMPEFPGLNMESVQGDRVALDIFTRLRERPSSIALDFSDCPDLYPAVAITCGLLNITLQATGTDSLRIKESDRIAVIDHLLKSYHNDVHNFVNVAHDHRIAMAALAADMAVDDEACISKSYPDFLRQLRAMQGVERLSDLVTRITPRRDINDEGKGKKYALHKLISQAETDYVWLTDDDVQWQGAEWGDVAETIIGESGEADMIILPLTMSAGTGNLLCRLQQAEYAAIQQLTLEAARRGHAVMCSGANLLVRRDKWLAAYEDIHPEIPSGDDMFMLESFKRRGWKVAADDHILTMYRLYIDPISELRPFLRQRMRWAGKAPSYTDRDIIACGVLIGAVNLLQVVCPLILLIKFPIEYALILRRDRSVSLWTALLLEIIYPFYMLLCLLGGIFYRRTW